MSAGRYEVFIINPAGKRFRSKNEIKAFFEKTGEKGLNADDFDFATYGSGRNLEIARVGQNYLDKFELVVNSNSQVISMHSTDAFSKLCIICLIVQFLKVYTQ